MHACRGEAVQVQERPWRCYTNDVPHLNHLLESLINARSRAHLRTSGLSVSGRLNVSVAVDHPSRTFIHLACAAGLPSDLLQPAPFVQPAIVEPAMVHE